MAQSPRRRRMHTALRRHVGPFEPTTEDGQSIVIQDVANASGFKNNVLSASLLGRRGVSAELGVNSWLRKDDTTIAVHERYGFIFIF